ncbi:alpha/beta fold hydrolase [Streptomyces sp. NPDC059740]|uniref:alpha/beta fold hydrolase n=1 Tax=Streptomyces sp. NPDC059740 TaxID=3346926 RepID=UPI00365743BD
MVLVPGMLCDAALWDGVRPALTGLAGPLVDVLPDAPDIAGMARQVLDAVEGPFVLVGLSLGAIVGFEVVRRAPQRVAAFAALSTNAAAPTRAQLAAWREADQAAAEGRFASVVEQTLATMFAEPRPAPALDQAYRDMARRVGPERLRAQLAAQATRTDALPALAAYPGPTLVLCGGRDALCPPSYHVAIATAAPRARLRQLPTAGHLLPVEQPGATAEALGDWLAGVLPQPPPADR